MGRRRKKPADGSSAPSTSELLEQAVRAGDAEWERTRGGASEDDAASTATSAVTIESTHHLRQRREERDINKKELQQAIKHGVSSRDQATGHLQFFHNGICFVTDSTGKVGITSWVEDEEEASAARRERPAKLWFMHCSGRCQSLSCAASAAAANQAAARLLQSELQTAPSFKLLSLSSWKYSPSMIQPDEELAVVLEGEQFHLSPFEFPFLPKISAVPDASIRKYAVADLSQARDPKPGSPSSRLWSQLHG